MAAGPEIELKFQFAERDVAKVKALVAAASGARQATHQRLRTIYFDTPNQDLWNHGFTLRVRAIGESHVQSVKRIASSSIQGDEWDEQTGQPEPDLGRIKNTPLARLAGKPSIRRALRPVFEVDIERASFTLETGAGRIEASFDQGAIEANGEKLGVRELELELKSGDRSALFNLARAFVSQAPLHPSLISKAERGHLLAGGAWGRAAKSSTPRLGKDMTCRRAFQEICQTCLHDFHLNMPGLEKFDNVEAVHQGRIAIRRLRAAMALFKPMVFDIAYRRLRDELKWLAGLFGAARDMDVLRANLPPPTLEGQASIRAGEHAGDCEAKRLRAHQAVVEALDGERARTLQLDLAVWIEDGRWQRQPSGIAEEPIQRYASAHLRKRCGKLVKQGAGLAKLASGARHQIRIEAKKLRYMAEFFVDVPGVAKDRKRLKELIDCCAKLQAALGAIRDEEAMAEFMENEVWVGADAANGLTKTEILPAGPPPRPKGEIAKELQKAVRSYSKLAAIEPF
ncbi:MAG: CHAD domain-containing protein [Pseudomonadota bacterium]|nr:CHAD domain-containing protein [Pseudomonadota bacterium]